MAMNKIAANLVKMHKAFAPLSEPSACAATLHCLCMSLGSGEMSAHDVCEVLRALTNEDELEEYKQNPAAVLVPDDEKTIDIMSGLIQTILKFDE